MEISIKSPSFDRLKENVKKTAKEIVERPVPVGKTVLATTIAIGVVQVLIFRKYNVSIVITKA